jgi:putative glutamine amidotransferase
VAETRSPVIGIACAVLPAQWGPWHQPAAVVAADYIRQVQEAGAVAVVLPPHADAAAALLDVVDGLMLTGGNDIDAAAYEADPHPEAEVPDVERDAFESALVHRALACDMPLLGICRGMQVLNVALGGTLTQHLPESHGTHDHRRTTGTFDGNDHLVILQQGSLAAHAAGELVHRVPSHHHQAVDRVGEGLALTGRAEGDGVAEAIELPGRRFALGVQWHPEADPTSTIIAALVDAARGY